MPKIFYCLLLPLLFAPSFLVVDPDVQALLDKLAQLRKQYPQEKLLLHLDRASYSTTDTLYFKAYLLNADNNKPSSISNTFYVSLVDEEGNVVSTSLFAVADGAVAGGIAISENMPPGNYHVRAYTNWMRNFNDAYYFDKTVHIGNAQDESLAMEIRFNADSNAKNSIAAGIIFTPSKNNASLKMERASYVVTAINTGVPIVKDSSSINGQGIVKMELAKCIKNQWYELEATVHTNAKKTVTKTLVFKMPAAMHATQFMPEGGTILMGQPCRMAFKAYNAMGKAIPVAGEIFDNDKKSPVNFTGTVYGTGSFVFTPMPGHTYHAHVKYPDGFSEKIPLPVAQDAGYAIAADNTGNDNVQVRIATKSILASKLILVARYNNESLWAEKIPLVNGAASINIAKEKLHSGVVELTLFDDKLNPVAERLVYIGQHDFLQVSLKPDKDSYTTNEKAVITLDASTPMGEPAAGTFSVSVTTAGAMPIEETAQKNVEDVLLSGNMEDVAQYFNNATNLTATALDNFLLTQHRNSFAWKDILANKLPAITFKAENGLSISGKITTVKGAAVKNAKVTLLSKKGESFVLDTLSDADGKFTFGRLGFTGEMPFAITAIGPKGSTDVVIAMDELAPPPASYQFKNNFSGDDFSGSAIKNYLVKKDSLYVEKKKKAMQESITLQEVTVKTKALTRQEEAVAPSNNLNGPGNADQVITYDDIRNCSDLTICLPGRVRGVNFKGIMIKGAISMVPFANTGMGLPMLVVVDGQHMNTTNGSFSLKDIPAGDVQSIEVLRTGAYISTYGFKGSGGVLVITTKRGGLDYNGTGLEKNNSASPKGMLFFTKNGFAPATYFQPNISKDAGASSGMKNISSTIFWHPNITTDDEGMAALEVEHAVKGNYIITVEGISADGKIGKAQLAYPVK